MEAFISEETEAENSTADPIDVKETGSISQQAAQQRRASAVLAAVDKKQPFLAADQERVARNTHLLLEEMSRNRAVSKREVAVMAGLGGGAGTDSTKRLETYTLPIRASEARRSRLAKKPGKYVEIGMISPT